MPMTLSLNQYQISRQDLVLMLRQWGGVNSGGILDDNCLYFNHQAIPGLIGYRLVTKVAVVLGDPVCAPEYKEALALAFHDFCANEQLDVIYIMTSEDFALWAQQKLTPVLIEFGATLFLNPADNPYHHPGSQSKALRKKVHNCLHKGVTIKEYKGDDIRIETAITEIVNTWKNARKGPQIHLCQPSPFKDRIGKRWFYAEQDEQIIGSLILNELKVDNSWLLNNVMIKENSPNGLSELLVISTLNVLEAEGCNSVTIGPIPKNQLGKIIGLNSFISVIPKIIYKASQYFFNLSGHETFWEKFQPRQQGSYLIFPHQNISYTAIKAIIYALHRD